jgi:hypothetical protein
MKPAELVVTAEGFGIRTAVNGQAFDLRSWEDEKAGVGDVVPSRASRKANGRLFQAVEAVGGHSLPQSKPHPSPDSLIIRILALL